ncbi:hypothetical protein [Trichormus variabilis]|nr:hypothetical protein [Trichormus variabilis]MBD2629249.1 hypothetical protein [Trichormus variabilis FACHB-164]
MQRNIKVVIGTILLLSSTSVSSFAATNTITSGKFQSDTVKLPVESIPSRQLNFTQDTYLIAGQMRNLIGRGNVGLLFGKFDDIWKDPANNSTQDPANSRKTRLFDHCKTQTDFKNEQCLSFLQLWILDTEEDLRQRSDYSQSIELMNILNEFRKE